MATRVETERIAARRRVPPRRRARIRWSSIAKHGILDLALRRDPLPALLGVPALDQVASRCVHERHLAARTSTSAPTGRRSPRSTRCRRTSRTASSSRSSTMLITTTIAVLAGYALVHLPTPGQGARAGDPRRLPLRAEPGDRTDLDLGDPGPARADQLDLGTAPPLPDARPGGEHLHHARRLRDDSEGAPGVRARRRRELVHDPAPHHAAARAQRRHRRHAHQLHRGVGRVAAREHAHERPGQADADGGDRVGERGLRTVAVADDGGDVRRRDPARPDRSSSS